MDPAIGEEFDPLILQSTCQATERVGVGVGYIIPVALVDADAHPVDASTDNQPGQRKAERLASIAKLSAGDFM
jgi:hypothetical protein